MVGSKVPVWSIDPELKKLSKERLQDVTEARMTTQSSGFANSRFREYFDMRWLTVLFCPSCSEWS
jgi:hypothetical protein